MSILSKTCKGLKRLSCKNCGLSALLENCSSLERLCLDIIDYGEFNKKASILPGNAAFSLNHIILKNFYPHRFPPLIFNCINLRKLKLLNGTGTNSCWDAFFESAAGRLPNMIAVNFDIGWITAIVLATIATCSKLQKLRLSGRFCCTTNSLELVSKHCTHLQKLKIRQSTRTASDEVLIAITAHSFNLEDLNLVACYPSVYCLEQIGTNCPKLMSLEFEYGIGDEELSCIAANYSVLKNLRVYDCSISDHGIEALPKGCPSLAKLRICGCPISDHGIEALASDCPSLVKLENMQCPDLTSKVADWLRSSRKLVDVSILSRSDVLEALAQYLSY